jgi:hypothetical protein
VKLQPSRRRRPRPRTTGPPRRQHSTSLLDQPPRRSSPSVDPRTPVPTMFSIRIPHFQRKWKWPKVLIALMVIELGGTVAALALFGIASPNLYRTTLWRIGSDNGFNSSPLQILYAYANYRPLPKTPFVWSQTYVSLPPLSPNPNQISNPR